LLNACCNPLVLIFLIFCIIWEDYITAILLQANLTHQEARLTVAMADLAAAEQELEERERALQEVKEQYDAAVSEKQRLTDAANNCLRKMTAATALINGLGGEKIRWTQMSQQFKEQLGRSVVFF